MCPMSPNQLTIIVAQRQTLKCGFITQYYPLTGTCGVCMNDDNEFGVVSQFCPFLLSSVII